MNPRLPSVKRSTCDNSSQGIDNGRNTAIGAANKRQTGLDGAQTRLLEVLEWPRRRPEPGIIRQVNDGGYPAGRDLDLVRKDDLVADQRIEAETRRQGQKGALRRSRETTEGRLIRLSKPKRRKTPS